MATTELSKSDAIELQEPIENDLLKTVGQDEADMGRLGRQQQLKRNFHSMATLGLNCMVMTTWCGMIAGSQFVLVDGGRAGMIWLFIITWIFQVPVFASMAEMSSMAPTSSGQYHWVSEFSPPSLQKYMSYVSGWLSALGWQAIIATTSYSAGQFILILASLDSSYVPTPWQGCLMTIAFVSAAASINIFAARWVPLVESLVLFFFVFGLFAVCIPLWVLAPKAPSWEIWTQFSNGGNWATTGGATMIGFLTTSGAFVGADAAAHVAEEVRDASRAVPRAMMSALFLNGALAFMMVVTFVYSIQDVDRQIIHSAYAFPFIGIFADATNSNTGAIGMTIPWAVIAVASCMTGVAAGSRQAWAFSRDGGLPWSPWFQKVQPVLGTPVPVNSVIASTTITIILSFIQIGSTEAFNSIVGLVGGAIGFAYTISIGCVLWRRLYGAPLPPARWSRGRWGVPFNIVGVLFEVMCTVISFFPQFSAVAPANMNWSSLMFGAVAILATLYYVVHGRRVYVGPVALIKRE